jgi:hypothetical protein
MPGRYRAPQANAGWADQQQFLKRVFEGEMARDRVSWRFESKIDADYDFSKNVRLE